MIIDRDLNVWVAHFSAGRQWEIVLFNGENSRQLSRESVGGSQGADFIGEFMEYRREWK